MSKYNIYCDETCHLENDRQKAMAIGGVWCPYEIKDEIYRELRELKKRHGLSPDMELKWNKVSMGQIDYYLDVVRYFFSKENLNFRVLVVPNKEKLDHKRFNQTNDDFYYKMYFDMLKVIFEPNNEYNIFIDIKDTRSQEKVKKLHDVLCNNSYDFKRDMIKKLQQVRSHEIELIALADFFTGAVGYINRNLHTSDAKLAVIDLIKEKSGYNLKCSTLYKETKFNIFIWKENYGK